MASKIILDLPGGVKVWINPQHVIKMEKTAEGRYFLRLINGEVYEIGHRQASNFEEFLEEL